MTTSIKTFFITGVSRGLGYELSRLLCASGAKVFGLLRDPAQTPEWSGQFPDTFIPIVGDVCDDGVVQVISSSLDSSETTVDVLINNAGIKGAGSSITEVAPSDVRSLLDVHCVGALRITQAVLPSLRRSSRPLILNMSSRLGSLSKVSSGELDHLKISYSGRIAKASLNMLTVCLQRELNPEGIGVFAIHPGRLRTRMGNPDADMSAEEGAQRIVNWLAGYDGKQLSGYLEPGVGPIAW